MRIWKSKPALTAAAAAVLALPVLLFLRHDVIDTLMVLLIGAALVGNYLLRRYARAELLYHRPPGRHTSASGSGSRNEQEGAPCRSGEYAM